MNLCIETSNTIDPLNQRNSLQTLEHNSEEHWLLRDTYLSAVDEEVDEEFEDDEDVEYEEEELEEDELGDDEEYIEDDEEEEELGDDEEYEYVDDDEEELEEDEVDDGEDDDEEYEYVDVEAVSYTHLTLPTKRIV